LKACIHEKLAPSLLAASIVGSEDAEGRKIGLRLLFEYEQKLNLYLKSSLNFLGKMLWGKKWDEEVINTLASEEFIQMLSQLPSYSEALAKFPAVKATCDSQARRDAPKLLQITELILEQESKHFRETHGLLVDPISDELLGVAVDMHPLANVPPINYTTFIRYKNSQYYLKHPFTHEDVEKVTPSYETPVDISQLQGEMIVALKSSITSSVEGKAFLKNMEETLGSSLGSETAKELALLALSVVELQKKAVAKNYFKLLLEAYKAEYFHENAAEGTYLKDLKANGSDHLPRTFDQTKKEFLENLLNIYAFLVDEEIVDLASKFLGSKKDSSLPFNLEMQFRFLEIN
jgi:hypothetical protein